MLCRDTINIFTYLCFEINYEFPQTESPRNESRNIRDNVTPRQTQNQQTKLGVFAQNTNCWKVCI